VRQWGSFCREYRSRVSCRQENTCLPRRLVATDTQYTLRQAKGKCAWLFETKELLDESCFLKAVQRLVERHEALRYIPLSSPEWLNMVQTAAGLHLALADYCRDVAEHTWSYVFRRFVNILQQICAVGLKHAWPKIRQKGGEASDSSVRVVRCTRWGQVTDGVRKQGKEFESPFSIGLYLLQPSKPTVEPGSYIHIICTHAFSDGFSSFPLISDLAELYEAELAVHLGKEAPAVPAGPPSAFEELQRRLFDALEVQTLESAPDQCSLRSALFWEATLPDAVEPCQYAHTVCFSESTVAALRAVGARYAAPLDTVLLGAVAGALLRTGVCNEVGRLTGELSPVQLLTLVLYAPMRDGASNEAMVGLFSDWRELSVAATPHCRLTVLGIVLEMAMRIRARQWSKYDPVQNGERILVNILAMDERPRGACGFQQTRLHEGWPEHLEKRGRVWSSTALRPMRLTLEQYELQRWFLALDLAEDRFPPRWCRQFVVNLQSILNELVARPLTPVV